MSQFFALILDWTAYKVDCFHGGGIGEDHATPKPVNKPYYLFQTDEDGTIVAVEEVIGLDQVKRRLMKLQHRNPARNPAQI